jgi:hypothetical protein
MCCNQEKMARPKVEFKKGDGATHYAYIPAASWSAGGKLFFAAKPVPDDDNADTAAVINTTFTDSVVSDETVDDVAYKKYTMSFVGSDANGIAMGGKKKKKFLGEFQFVPSSGQPTTWPGDDQFLDVIVYADIKRGTT